MYQLQLYKILNICYEELKNYEECENNYKQIYEILKLTEENEMKSETCLKLAEILIKNNNKHEAKKYYIEYYDEAIKLKQRNYSELSLVKLSTALITYEEEVDHFFDYMNLSKNKLRDILSYKTINNIKNQNFRCRPLCWVITR